jgi:tripartite-type tricarboxylate transporter receptor subunit TctC
MVGSYCARKTPKEIIQKMHTAMTAVLKRPDIAKKLDEQGIDIVAGGPEVFNPFLDKQMNTWGKFIIENKIKETN